MKSGSDTIRNRTRDLAACSAVPQSTAPSRAPLSKFWWNIFLWFRRERKKCYNKKFVTRVRMRMIMVFPVVDFIFLEDLWRVQRSHTATFISTLGSSCDGEVRINWSRFDSMRHQSTHDIWSSEGTDYDSDQHVRERLAISQREIQILLWRSSRVSVEDKSNVSGRNVRLSLVGGSTPRRHSCSESSSRRFSLPFHPKLLERLSRRLRAKACILRTDNCTYIARMQCIQNDYSFT